MTDHILKLSKKREQKGERTMAEITLRSITWVSNVC